MTHRLAIHHFLLWMFGCGVVMGLFNLIRSLNGFTDTGRDVLFEAFGGIAYGTAFAGLIMGVMSWRQGQQVASHPGHVLLYVAALVMVLDLGLTL
ncbi:MAG: hypothetical protein HYV60_00750, partial [Planctomycetia bacterium]|nr:hypothetical protein [Planctomycetia bacterium]